MTRSLARLGTLVIVMNAGTGLLFAQHWPAFRGPAGSGVADAQPLRTSWDAPRSTAILWKTALPGLGHSSPVVWGDRVFVTAAVSGQYPSQPQGRGDPAGAAAHEWRVLALDKNRGKILWSRTAHRGTPKTKRHIKATQANASPATDGHIVVVSFRSEGLYTYDMNGTLLWQHDLGILDPGTGDSRICNGASRARRSSTTDSSSCNATSRRTRSSSRSTRRMERAPGAPSVTNGRPGALR